jgi:mono/diheme cytochrome c family protein
MNDDVQKYIYRTIIVFVVGVMVWVGIIFINACGFSLSCRQAAAAVDRTPVPTLIPATMPAPVRYLPTSTIAPTLTTTEVAAGPQIPRPSKPGDPGEAVNLKGDVSSGEQIFAANCVACHGVKGVGNIPNPGSTDGTVPSLNPIDPLLKDPDPKIFATNVDLFIQHGSVPAGANPTFQMPSWGDLGLLKQQQIADLIAYLISLNP